METWDEAEKRIQEEPVDAYSLTADDAYKMEQENEDRRGRQKAIMDQWREDHDFMFVKRRDDEGWQQMVDEVLNA